MMRYKNKKESEYHDRNEKNIIQSIIPNIMLHLKLHLNVIWFYKLIEHLELKGSDLISYITWQKNPVPENGK